MSFVSVVVCKKYISVVADGRTVEWMRDGSCKVLNENENKIIKISEKAFICPTGFVEEYQYFIEKSNIINSVIDRGLILKESDIELWYTQIKRYITRGNFFEIKFGGLSVDGTYQVYNISNRESEILRVNYEGDKINFLIGGGETVDSKTMGNRFQELYQSTNNDLMKTIQKIQKTINDEVADTDFTVNKNKTYFRLPL